MTRLPHATGIAGPVHNLARLSAMAGIALGVASAPLAVIPARAQGSTFDVTALFATTCGWCHSDGGRAAGRGPQLMDTKRSDDFIRNRIKNGKQGAMPAFGGALNDAQIDDVIKYIHALKAD